MVFRDREGWLHFVFCDHGIAVDEKEMRDDDGDDMEDASGDEESWEWHDWLGLENLVVVLWPFESWLVPAILGKGNWLVNKIL